MTTLDRVVLSVLAVLLLVGAGVFLMVIWGEQLLMDLVLILYGSPLDVLILTLIIVLFSIYLLLTVIKRDTDRRSIEHSTELGTVRISLSSIQSLVAQATQEIDGIRDVAIFLTPAEPLNIRIEAYLLPDYNIPQLTENVQRKVRDYLRETVGIDVTNVEVFVKGIVRLNSKESTGS